MLKKKIQPAFKKIGITGVGWHTFRHTVGTMLAEMGEHQLMIRDYLRHSNLHVTNKYLQATTRSKRMARGKLVDAYWAGGTCKSARAIRLLDPNGPRLFLGVLRKPFKGMAGTTGLEPAASAVTGQRSNQLNYVPTRQINKMRNNQCLCGIARFAYVAHIAQDDLNCSYFGLNRP